MTQEKLRSDPRDAIMFSVVDVCAKIGIGKSTCFKLIARGDLKAAKIGKQVRIHRDDLESYLAKIRGAA